jgi:hypothetical protein
MPAKPDTHRESSHTKILVLFLQKNIFLQIQLKDSAPKQVTISKEANSN